MKCTWGWLVLAACGTDPQAVEITIPGTQALVTEKVDAGAWKKPSGSFDAGANATTYSFEIGNEIEIVVVCLRSGPKDAGQFDAQEVFATSEDAAITLGSWTPPDCVHDANGNDEPTGDEVVVSGTFDQTTHFVLGRQPAGVAAGGVPFMFSATPGPQDLVAYAGKTVLIERALDIAAGTSLGELNVARDGVLMPEIDVAGLVDVQETLMISNFLTMHSGAQYAWTSEDSHAALFVPKEALAPGDVQTTFVQMFGLPYAGHYRRLSSDPYQFSELELLSPIQSATAHAGGLGMTWTPIPEFFTDVVVASYKANDSYRAVTASKTWLDRHGHNQLDFDVDVDGYDPSWTTVGGEVMEIERYNNHQTSATAFDPAFASTAR